MKTISRIFVFGLLGLLGLAIHPACAQCGAPANLNVSHITGSAATVTWDYDTAVFGEPSGFLLLLTKTAGTDTTLFYPGSSNRRQALTGLDGRTDYRVLLVAMGCTDTASINFSTVCDAGGSLTIGIDSGVYNDVPIRMQRKYSISQQLFIAAEMSGVDTVIGLQFKMVSGLDRTRQVDIYLDTTSLEAYTNSTNYLSQSPSNRYFSGSVDFTQGWVTLMFDSAFAPVAGKGVVLTVVDNTGSTGGIHGFQVSYTDTARCVSVSGNTQSYNAWSADVMGTTSPGQYRTTTVFLTPCGASSCDSPYIISAEPYDNAVDLEWYGNGGTHFCVDWRYADSTEWQYAVSYTTATTLHMVGLNQHTDYVVRVGNLCVGDTAYDEVAVTTLCGREPIPFSEDFTNFTAPANGDIQRCWYRTASAGNWPQYKNSTYYALSGSGSMEFKRRAALVLPLMQANVATLAVEFWGASWGNIGHLEVGVAIDPTDTSTYMVVKTVNIGNVANTWEHHTIYLDGYTGNGEYIFLRDKDNLPLNKSFYIDNLTVDYIPQCRIVEAMTIENVTDSSVTLLIDDEYEHDTYTLRWEADSVADSMTVPPSAVATIGGLQPSTVYSIMVRGNCGTEHSQWTPLTPSTVRTACGAIAVTDSSAYFEDFEAGDLSCMWQLDDSNHIGWTLFAEGEVVDCEESTAHSASHATQLGYNTTSRPGSVMLVLPTFDFSQLSGDAALSFWHYQAYDNDYGFLAAIEMNEEFGGGGDTVNWYTPAMRIYYRTVATAPWQLLATIDQPAVNLWQQQYLQLPASQGAATYQVAIQGFVGIQSGCGNFIDDISVSLGGDCMAPTNVAVSDISELSATVSWSGDAPAYLVQWRHADSSDWRSLTITDTHAVIHPLESSAPYIVYVSSLCPNGGIVPSNILQFNTVFCLNSIMRSNVVIADTVTVYGPHFTNSRNSYTETLIRDTVLNGLDEILGFEFYVADPAYRLDPFTGDTLVDFEGRKMCMGAVFTNVDIYMGLTSDSTLGTIHFDSTFRKVCEGCDMSFRDTGAHRIFFDSAFVWDGQSNVILGIYHQVSHADVMGMEAVQYVGYRNSKGDTLSVARYSEGATFSLNPNAYDYIHNIQSGLLAGCNPYSVPKLTFLGCEPLCIEPLVGPVSTTRSSITVSWYNQDADMTLSIREAGSSNPWSSPVSVSDTSTYTFTGLEQGTVYEILLSHDCGDGETSVTVEASTSICYPVSDLVAEVVDTVVELNWTAGENNVNWVVHCIDASGASLINAVDTNHATINGLTPGETYTIRVTPNCGESGDFWFGEPTVTEVTIPNVGIDNVKGDSVAIYPNPTTGKTTVSIGSLDGAATLDLIGMDGRILGTYRMESTTLELDLSGYVAGAYFLRLRTTTQNSVHKLVVK